MCKHSSNRALVQVWSNDEAYNNKEIARMQIAIAQSRCPPLVVPANSKMTGCQPAVTNGTCTEFVRRTNCKMNEPVCKFEEACGCIPSGCLCGDYECINKPPVNNALGATCTIACNIGFEPPQPAPVVCDTATARWTMSTMPNCTQCTSGYYKSGASCRVCTTSACPVGQYRGPCKSTTDALCLPCKRCSSGCHFVLWYLLHN
jgi:hypothetical protein